jgi:hypothetical protein
MRTQDSAYRINERQKRRNVISKAGGISTECRDNDYYAE